MDGHTVSPGSFSTPAQGPLTRAALLLLPLLLWAAAQRSTLAWLGGSFAMARPTNLALLAAVAAVLVYGLAARRPDRPGGGLRFRARPLPVALTLAAAFLDLLLRQVQSLPQPSVFCFVLGTFGLLGGVLRPGSWRRALPAAVLLACALPFGARFGIGLGYPARVLTARLVEQVLASLGVASLPVHDIILLENGVAHVDLPCSGLKSLWTGAVFFLAATWIEGRALGWRWLAGFGLFQGLLLLANSLRVLLLVLFGLVLGLPRLAEILHTPLGVFGFLACCAAGVALLRCAPAGRSPGPAPPAEPRPLPAGWLLLPLALLAAAMPPLAPSSEGVSPPAIGEPPGIAFRPLPMTPVEAAFFADQPGTVARKGSFEHRGLGGSLLLVATTSWQAHHAPELCLVSSSQKVDSVAPASLGGGLEVQHLRLGDGARTAVYWFQSPERTTGSLLRRFWRDLVHGERRWVMVSLLLSSAADPDSPDLRALLRRIHRHVHTGLRPDSERNAP